MKYLIVLLCTFFLWMNRPSAQDLEGGLFLGLASYQGDLIDGIVDLKELNIAYGLLLRRYLYNERWALRANFYAGKLSGDDTNSSKFKERAFKFQSDFYELSTGVEWYFFDHNRYTSTGRRLNTFNIYIFAGAGAVFFDPVVQGDMLPEKMDYSKVALITPVGGGLKFDLLPKTSIVFEVGLRPSLSDFLDGIGGPEVGSANDWYGLAGLQITLLLN